MQYILAVLIVVISSGICFLIEEYIGYRSVSFILLFTVSILSMFMGIGPIALASTLSALIWNFFFIPPRFNINIDTTEDVLMLGMFFIIALVNGVLTSRVRKQEKLTRNHEKQTNALYQLTKGLSASDDINKLAETAAGNIRKYFGFEIVIFLQDGYNNLNEYPVFKGSDVMSPGEKEMAEWVFGHNITAGKFTEMPGSTEYTFYPLKGNNISPGVMAVKQSEAIPGKEDEFWGTFLTQISNAFEREILNALAAKARFLDESDKLYRTLFNSISHELRIPLATIITASESLLSTHLPDDLRKELTGEILKGSGRLNRLIENLLNMSRLESGHITPKPDWCDIHDLINKVTDSLRDELKPFILQVIISDDMPLIMMDFGLMEQVLYNLVFNVTQLNCSSPELVIKAFYENGFMTMEVMDRGPGVPEKEIPFIFNKFYRLEGSKAGGTGLGLSIARGFTEAHKGTIVVENRKEGGAKFIVRIPSDRPVVEIK